MSLVFCFWDTKRPVLITGLFGQSQIDNFSRFLDHNGVNNDKFNILTSIVYCDVFTQECYRRARPSSRRPQALLNQMVCGIACMTPYLHSCVVTGRASALNHWIILLTYG